MPSGRDLSATKVCVFLFQGRGDGRLKNRVYATMIISIVFLFEAVGVSAKTQGFNVHPINAPFIQPIQGSPFQPILLAFDGRRGQLIAATPGAGKGGSSILLFRQPGNPGVSPESIFNLSGVASGLSYDAEGRMLFVSNATKREVMIFDRFDARDSGAPTRTLHRFNFPTGVGFDRASKRLFVADAHPGAVLVFEGLDRVQGGQGPSRTLGGETGLNGPFAIVADRSSGRLYVSNFDGVFAFRLDDLSAPPTRLPLAPGTLARGLALDPKTGRLYIAAPMRKSYFIYDGEGMKEVKLQAVQGAFPFSISLDEKNDRLYLAGTEPRIGIIEQAGGPPGEGPSETNRMIDRWIPLSIVPPGSPDRPSPSPPRPFHPTPPRPSPRPSPPDGPSMINFPTNHSPQKNTPLALFP